MRGYKYILDDNGRPVPEPDLYKWGAWFEDDDNRRVRHDTCTDISIRVSTVFLGLDHSFSDAVDPILWETMIFGGEHDGYQKRYTSKKAALAGHKKALKLVND